MSVERSHKNLKEEDAVLFRGGDCLNELMELAAFKTEVKLQEEGCDFEGPATPGLKFFEDPCFRDGVLNNHGYCFQIDMESFTSLLDRLGFEVRLKEQLTNEEERCPDPEPITPSETATSVFKDNTIESYRTDDDKQFGGSKSEASNFIEYDQYGPYQQLAQIRVQDDGNGLPIHVRMVTGDPRSHTSNSFSISMARRFHAKLGEAIQAAEAAKIKDAGW